jgi:hypothetical protein
MHLLHTDALYIFTSTYTHLLRSFKLSTRCQEQALKAVSVDSLTLFNSTDTVRLDDMRCLHGEEVGYIEQELEACYCSKLRYWVLSRLRGETSTVKPSCRSCS